MFPELRACDEESKELLLPKEIQQHTIKLHVVCLQYIYTEIFLIFGGKSENGRIPEPTIGTDPVPNSTQSSGRLLFDGTVFDPSQTIIDVICHSNHSIKETLSSLELDDLSKCQAKEDISSTWSRRLSIRSNL